MGGGSLKWGPSLFKRDLDSLFFCLSGCALNDLFGDDDLLLVRWTTFWGQWTLFVPVSGTDFSLGNQGKVSVGPYGPLLFLLN